MARTAIYTPGVTLGTDFSTIIAQSCEVDGLLFCNKSDADATVTVTDVTGGINLVYRLQVPAHTSQQVPLKLPGPTEASVYAAGGVQWKASATASIDGFITARV
jgi:hypothetical protein